jgi:hypothetical protein
MSNLQATMQCENAAIEAITQGIAYTTIMVYADGRIVTIIDGFWTVL